MARSTGQTADDPPRPDPRRRASVPGRAQASAPPESRGRILDAAERHFAVGGYDAVALRAISTTAGVDLGLVGYHFGSKEELYAEVLRRHADRLNRDRLRRLDEARSAAADAYPTLDAIVAAYARPLIDFSLSGDESLRSYSRLLARAGWQTVSGELMAELMDPTASHFINALRHALPGVAPAAIHWGYQFLKSVLMNAVAENGRIDLLSRGMCRSSDVEAAYAHLVPFMSAGFEQLRRSAAD